MKYYLIAGEASGDVHASKLMKGLITGDPEAEFRCWEVKTWKLLVAQL